MPVNFELSNYSDDRFKKVKIWIAHTGENLNNSYFEKSVLEDMSKTLAGVPIVGYIERVEGTEDDDFSDHRNEITIKKDGIKMRYAGHAYGFIPEDNNNQFELRDGKEWLTCEGYLWSKFRDAIEIFDDVNGIKSQSMEIDNVEGVNDELGRLEVLSSRFSALCILGENVSPAMSGSTIEFFEHKKDQYQFELNQMMMEFKKEKGELDLPTAEPTNVTIEPEEPIVVQEPVVEPTTVAEPENFSSNPEPEPTPEPTVPAQVEPEPEPTTEPAQTSLFSMSENTVSINFELSHSDVRHKLYKALRNSNSETNAYPYVLEVYDNKFIYELVDYSGEETVTRTVEAQYEKDGEGVTIGEHTEVFGMYVTSSEKQAIENQRDEIASLQSQLQELQGFKANFELAQKEAMVAEFAEDLGAEADEIRSKFAEYSLKEVETEIALKCFQVMKKQKEEDSRPNTVSNFQTESKQDARYGELDKYFTNQKGE